LRSLSLLIAYTAFAVISPNFITLPYRSQVACCLESVQCVEIQSFGHRMKKLLLLLTVQFVCLLATAQTTLQGTLKDANGDPVSGATIIEKGTNIGTLSDGDGMFRISYKDEKSVLVISMMGYEPQEIVPGQNATLDVTLSEKVYTVQGMEIVGTRNLNRSATETPTAVEIIPIATVTNSTGQLDLNQVLQFVSPSFNSNRQSGADGADHIDPATLRGLGPDQTLVLINGKRRHQSSLVNLYGTRGRGNTGTDLNTIPAAAIERIEILRDGAAAQYGSDAIAGVINIVLKQTTDEFSGNLNMGAYPKNSAFSGLGTGINERLDGINYNLNGNYGFKVGETGFVNVTLDYLHRGHTYRDAAMRDAAGNDTLHYRRQFGDAQQDNFNAFFNAVLPIKNGAEFYTFGGYNFREGDAYAWTRDSSDDRNVPSIYPNGFDPHILSKITDKSLSTGLRGKVGDWSVDLNNTFGDNSFRYFVNGSLNSSLGIKSPTSFDAGGFGLTQNTTGLNFTRNFADALKGVNVAFGTEYRIDNYRIYAGEEASYRNYGVIDTVINGTLRPYDVLGLAAGSQGFPGFQPSNELNAYRTNLAAYFDVEADVVKGWTVAAAVRGERYSDFGNIGIYKIATRYAITPWLAVRGSANSGFRAPSLAQMNFNSTYTNVVGGVIQDQFLAKNNSNITNALGIGQLTPERSQSFSFGFTMKPLKSLSLTVDGYSVSVRDRIVLTGTFSPNTDSGHVNLPWENELAKLNVVGAQFFANALDTKTLGVDIIATHTMLLGPGRLQTSLAANINKMTLSTIHTSALLEGQEDTYFGAREKAFLLASAPPFKVNLTLDYKINRFSINLRFVQFGGITLVDWADENDVYKAALTTDLALGYSLTEKVNLVLGSSNIMNTLPTIQNIDTESGGRWDPVQMGFNGRLVFARLRWKF
jgi:iron complex outermembrane recepter protein